MQTPDVHAALLPDRLEERRQRIRERVEEMQRAGYSRDQALYGALEEAWRTEALENDRLWDQADEIVALKGCLANFALRDIAAAPGSGLDTVGLWVRRGAVRDAVALIGDVTAHVVLTERDETFELPEAEL